MPWKMIEQASFGLAAMVGGGVVGLVLLMMAAGR